MELMNQKNNMERLNREMKVERTHDQFYIREDRKNNPKEYFKFFVNRYADEIPFNANFYDFGCATGELIYYLNEELNHIRKKNITFNGVDVMDELLNKAKMDMPELTWIKEDISSPDFDLFGKGDVCTCFGVLSIFDNWEFILDNIMKSLSNSGICFLFGIFNPYNYDVYIKSKKSLSDEDVLESGWNIISIKSMEEYCKRNGYEVSYEKFNLSIDIPKHEDDYLRSWTININKNEKMITNGLQIIHNFYFFRIKK